jgi:DHA1 family tetracycline resistance protein-like MFS transporter
MLNKHAAGIPFIMITCVLDMVAFGIMIPVFQPLLLHFTGGNFSQAALLSGAFAMVFAVVQLFSSPVIGVLSDQVGRRPVVLLSNLGTFLDFMILALAPNIAWLFVGRVIAGFTTGSIATASAYIADVTPADKRAGAYGMISAAFGVGFVLGPAIGGPLGQINIHLPFFVAGALSLLNFAYGFFALPESLRKEDRNAFAWSRANPFGAVKMLRRHAELAGLAIVNLIGYVAHDALPQVFVLYTLYVFNWSQNTIGLSLAVVGIETIIIMALLINPIVKAFGERKAVLIGLFFGAVGFFMYGGGNQIWFWAAITVNMLWMIGTSASQAIMTRRVERNEQGELQGAINMLRSFGTIVGPMVFSTVFAYSVSPWHAWKLPSIAWSLGGILLFVSLFIAARVTSASDDVVEEIDTTRALESALAADVPIVD